MLDDFSARYIKVTLREKHAKYRECEECKGNGDKKIRDDKNLHATDVSHTDVNSVCGEAERDVEV